MEKGEEIMTKVMLMTTPLVTNKDDLKKSAMNNGLLYIGSYLRNNGHDVTLVDTIIEGWNNVRHQKDNVTEFGLPNEDLEKKVIEYNPDIIGINLAATVSYPGFLRQIKFLKQKFPNKMIIAGGAHLTALPEKSLRDSLGNLDYIVHGEGEKVALNIANNVNNTNAIQEQNGVAYLDANGKFFINPAEPLIKNLDDIGDLAIDLIKDLPFTLNPTYGGSAHGKKYADLFLSRGCPRNCGFCYTPQMWRRVVRKHSLNWISKTLDQFIDAGFGHFIIQDDNFSRMGDWSYSVMDLFKDKNVTWEDNGGLEMESLDPEIIERMANTNCTTLFIPLNLRTNNTNKVSRDLLNQYTSVLKAAKENGIFIYTAHIMGFPDQTIEGMRIQTEFAKYLIDTGLSDFHVVYGYSVLPGTGRFHQVMEPTKNGEYQVRADCDVKFHGGWQNWPLYSINHPQIGSTTFTYEELKEEYFQTINTINGTNSNQWFNGREWPKPPTRVLDHNAAINRFEPYLE